ncbi:MAG: hypothetical protein E7660_05905 [Ruminococcaceae bacterium]|nr:hypothetical protein [Oscillospiraceae bacterium]
MKKAYSKPEINFDSFGLQASFAAGCAVDAEYQSGSCAVVIAGMPVFVDNINSCVITTQDGDFDLCYYVPTADNMVFTS